MNISCPNVESGLDFGVDPERRAEVTHAVRRRTQLPLLVKLSPNITDLVSIAAAVVDAGADALTLINTFPAMRIDIGARRPALGWGSGGLSGPALRPIAVAHGVPGRERTAVACQSSAAADVMSGDDAVEC